MNKHNVPHPPDEPPVRVDPNVHMAAERTLLAWIRTGLSMMGFGFVVARFGVFLREVAVSHNLIPTRVHGASLWLGVVLVGLGVAVNAAAAARYAGATRAMRLGRPYQVAQPDLGVLTAILLAVVGAAMAVYLVVAAQ